jgi:hypothetical protein
MIPNERAKEKKKGKSILFLSCGCCFKEETKQKKRSVKCQRTIKASTQDGGDERALDTGGLYGAHKRQIPSSVSHKIKDKGIRERIECCTYRRERD